MSRELKPCPCCVSDNIIPPPDHWPDGCVYCRNCGLRANSPDAWNTRALDRLSGGGEALDLLEEVKCAEDHFRRHRQMDDTVTADLLARVLSALSQPIARANVDREKIARQLNEWMPCVLEASIGANGPGSFTMATWDQLGQKVRDDLLAKADAILALLNTMEGQDNG